MYRIVRCDCGEYLIVRSHQRYAKCPRCGVRLALQRLVTYERSSDLEYLRRLLYHLRRRTI